MPHALVVTDADSCLRPTPCGPGRSRSPARTFLRCRNGSTPAATPTPAIEPYDVPIRDGRRADPGAPRDRPARRRARRGNAHVLDRVLGRVVFSDCRKLHAMKQQAPFSLTSCRRTGRIDHDQRGPIRSSSRTPRRARRIESIAHWSIFQPIGVAARRRSRNWPRLRRAAPSRSRAVRSAISRRPTWRAGWRRSAAPSAPGYQSASAQVSVPTTVRAKGPAKHTRA